MGTVRGGSIICDRCSDECRSLYGFAITTDRISHSFNENMKKIVEKIDREYGKHDFVLCWRCTIRMMGIPTLAEAKADADAQKSLDDGSKKFSERFEGKNMTLNTKAEAVEQKPIVNEPDLATAKNNEAKITEENNAD